MLVHTRAGQCGEGAMIQMHVCACACHAMPGSAVPYGCLAGSSTELGPIVTLSSSRGRRNHPLASSSKSVNQRGIGGDD